MLTPNCVSTSLTKSAQLPISLGLSSRHAAEPSKIGAILCIWDPFNVLRSHVGSTCSSASNALLQKACSGYGAGMVLPVASRVTKDFKSLDICTETPSFRRTSFLIPCGINQMASVFATVA